MPVLLVIAWDVVRMMSSGFWIDECGAYWLALHPWTLVQPPFTFASLSFLYSFILSLFVAAEPPWREPMARLPSLLAAMGCAACIYSLSEKLNGKGTGWIAALLYAVLPGTLHHATEARPYALSQFTFAAALWMFQAWLQSGSARMLAAHTLSLVTLVYLHPFFGLAWPLCWTFAMATRPDLRRRYSSALLGAATLLVPLAFVATHNSIGAQSITYLPSPVWSDLPMDLLQDRVGPAVLAAVLATVLAKMLWRARTRSSPAPLFAWAVIWLTWPLVLFALARLTGSSFYVSRYMALSAVGFVLLAAGGLSFLRPSWRYLGMVLLLLLHVAPGNRARQLRDGDMRPLAAWLEAGGGGAPWLANSLFVESSIPDPSPHADQLAGWLFSHVSAYPVTNAVFPMPWQFAEFARPALEAQLDNPWRAENRILAGPLRTPPPQWLLDLFARRGYRYTRLGDIHEFTR